MTSDAGIAPGAGADCYRPRRRLGEAWASRALEVITDGPAGTGKSRMWLDRLYQVAVKYPRSRHLICRKTRESLTESALVTFEDKVLPPGTPWAGNQSRRVRQAYHLPNGSQIVVGGLDKPEKLFSTEYDTVYVQEATELLERDWELFLRSLRNGRMPYQQLVGDCNPGPPGHWIKQRAATGALQLIPSRHEDNPELWDDARSAWTPKGVEYLARLDALTGVRHKRLRLGLWVAAENVVYADWDPAVHLVDRFPIPASWPRYRSVDFGFTNPFCCQWWATDPDGRAFRYRELYGTETTVRDWAHKIATHSAQEQISATITDHDVESRLELEAHMTHTADHCTEQTRRPATAQPSGPRFTVAAQKSVDLGIEKVAARLKRAGDGDPRLFLLRDSLVARDPLLVDAKRPTCAEEEIEAYAWDRATSKRYGEVLLEQPLKLDDHAMDAMRYVVMHLDGPRSLVAGLYGLSSRGT